MFDVNCVQCWRIQRYRGYNLEISRITVAQIVPLTTKSNVAQSMLTGPTPDELDRMIRGFSIDEVA